MAHDQPGLDDGVYYGIAQALRAVWPEARSVFEVGCGTGRLSKQLRAAFPSVNGCDPDRASVLECKHAVPDGHFATASIAQCGAVLGRYDLALSWQVLEHLDPGDVGWSLAGMLRLSEVQVHSICLAPPESYGRRDPSHTLLRSCNWWQETFGLYGFLEDFSLREKLLQAGGWEDTKAVELFVLKGSLPHVSGPTSCNPE